MFSSIFSDIRKFSSAELFFFLLIYLSLGIFNLQEIGVVGEAATLWTSTPKVLISTQIPTQSCQGSLLELCQTRPSVSFFNIPLMLNTYSGGIFDLPAKITFELTNSWRLVQILNLIFGFGIVLLTIQIALTHFSRRSAFFTLALLCSDASFILYKKWLYGIEVGLQVGLLLTLWGALELKRNNTGHRKLAIGVFIAVYAKWTALIAIVPLCLFLKRKPLLLLLPALIIPTISFVIHADLYAPVRSHDGWFLQWNRILSSLNNQSSLSRESWLNLPLFLLQPTEFFHYAYNAKQGLFLWPFRLVGWICVLFCIFKKKHNSTTSFFFCLTLLQMLALSYIAKDMHHLAMLTPCVLLLVANALSTVRWGSFALLTFIIPSTVELIHTDDVLKTIQTPTFTAESQQNLLNNLSSAKVNHLVTMDYEIYGVIEALNPKLSVTHTWAAISHEKSIALPNILSLSVNKHLIVLEASQPMIYNLRPSEQQLTAEAKKLGLIVSPISEWSGARLYAISKQ